MTMQRISPRMTDWDRPLTSQTFSNGNPAAFTAPEPCVVYVAAHLVGENTVFMPVVATARITRTPYSDSVDKLATSGQSNCWVIDSYVLDAGETISVSISTTATDSSYRVFALK